MSTSTPIPDATMAQSPETDWSSEATINASLSHLEDLHYQIQTLRTLMPTRLLAPLRGVTSPNLSSGHSLTSPESLYVAINSSITAGQNELLRFREAWEDEATANIREQAHKRRCIDPKGWVASVPEGMGLRGGFEGDGEDTDHNLENGEAERESEPDGLDELGGYAEGMDFQKTVEAFQKDNPKIRVHSAGEVAIVVIRGARLRVEKKTKGDEAGHWGVTRKEEDNKTPLMRAMLLCVERRGRKGDLRFLLDLLSSYTSVETAPCTACGKLLDARPRAPYLRVAVPKKEVVDGVKKFTYVWEARHETCESA